MRANAVLCCLLLTVGAIGCGDDGGSPDGGADSGGNGGSGGSGGSGTGGSGGRPVLPTPDGGGTGGSGEPGTAVEGEACATPGDCVEELDCFDTGFGFGICARGCATDGDCGAEVCSGGYCNNVVRTPFEEYCGAFDTAICSEALGLQCLLLSDLPIGVCATICSSGDADAGVSEDDTCGEGTVCVGGLVQQQTAEDPDGLCGNYVDRHGQCGIMMGTFCGDEDLCTPMDPTYDPETEETTFRCHADCTPAGADCPVGSSCTPYRDIAFCLPLTCETANDDCPEGSTCTDVGGDTSCVAD